jgi:hypothetical protein
MFVPAHCCADLAQRRFANRYRVNGATLRPPGESPALWISAVPLWMGL